MTTSPAVDQRIWLITIVAGGLALRLYGLGDQSLWADEGLSYFVGSAGDVGEVLRRAAERSLHPPLGFLLNHLALQVQDSDTMMRLPSALLGAATIPLIYLLGRALAWPAAALAAAAIVAVSPFHLWHSQDARMYSALLLVVTAMTLILLWTMAAGRPRAGGALYSLTAALGLYLHAFAVIPIAVHGAWLLLCRPRWLPWLVLVAAIAVVLGTPVTLDWATFVLGRLVPTAAGVELSGAHRSSFDLLVLPYSLYAFAVGYSFGPDLAALHGARSLAFLGRFWVEILLVTLVFGGLLTCGALALLRRTMPNQVIHVLLGLSLPLLFVLLLATATSFAFNVRYVIAAYPYFCILLGAGIAWLASIRRAAGWLAALAVIGLSLWSWSNYLTEPRFAKEDLRAAVQVWQADGAQGPLFSLATAGGVHDAVDRYLTPEERVRHVRVDRSKVAESIEAVMVEQGEPSAQVIVARDWDGQLEAAIAEGFELRGERDFAGVRLLEIALPNSP